MYLMQGLVGVVLLLCCVKDIGGLMMARIGAAARRFAVRSAVGASAYRLLRQYLVESFVIALAGSALGAAAAWFGSDFLLHFFRNPMMSETIDVHPDKAMFWMSMLFAVVTTLLFGTLPGWRAARTDPGLLLKIAHGHGWPATDRRADVRADPGGTVARVGGARDVVVAERGEAAVREDGLRPRSCDHPDVTDAHAWAEGREEARPLSAHGGPAGADADDECGDGGFSNADDRGKSRGRFSGGFERHESA